LIIKLTEGVSCLPSVNTENITVILKYLIASRFSHCRFKPIVSTVELAGTLENFKVLMFLAQTSHDLLVCNCSAKALGNF
jgi:hypothetical protein